MKTRILVLLTIDFLVGGAVGQQEKGDLEKIKGTWAVVKSEPDVNRGGLKNMKFVFGDGKVTLKGKDKDTEIAIDGTFKLDSAKKPKEMDITLLVGKQTDTLRALYLWDGDGLKICFNATPTPRGEEKKPNPRPTEFKADDKTGHVILTLERQKP